MQVKAYIVPQHIQAHLLDKRVLIFVLSNRGHFTLGPWIRYMVLTDFVGSKRVPTGQSIVIILRSTEVM